MNLRSIAALGVGVGLGACSGPRPADVRPASGTPGSGSAVGVQSVPIDAPPATQEETLAAIQYAMNELDEGAQGCWASAAVERFDIEGEVTATIEIAATRATVSIARDTTRNTRLTACLTSLLVGYRWAPPLHGQAIQLPFKFRAPEGQNVIDRALVPWNGQGKLAVAVLLDENNSNNTAASMFELALAAGGSTGKRVAERDELWYFLGPAMVEQTRFAAGDMMFVPAQHARDVNAIGVDMHAVVVMAPGGREGAARAGALPTRELGAIKSGIAGMIPLLRSAARVFCIGRGAVTPCTRTEASVTIFAELATTKGSRLAALLLEVPAGVKVSEHVHAKETELLYVLSGSGTMTVNGVALAVTPTSVIQIPPNTRHAFEATSDFRAVQLYTPAGPEQRFKGTK